MSEDTMSADLVQSVHHLVREYVWRKTETKSGVEWRDFKDRKTIDERTGIERRAVPEAYRDALEKVCLTAFLRLRSCKSREDFLEYFTATFCSVPQYLPDQEYQPLAMTLLDAKKWVEVKAVAMLTLSSLSHV